MIWGLITLFGAGLFWCGIGICYERIPPGRSALAKYLLCGGIVANLLLWSVFCPASAGLKEIATVALLMLPSGLAGIPAVVAFKKAMNNGSESVAWCIMQSAMVCPLLTMVVLYGERVSFSASAGVVLLFCGLFLFGAARKSAPASFGQSYWKFIGWTSLSFALTGLQQTLSMFPGKMPELSAAALTWRIPLMQLPNLLWAIPCAGRHDWPRWPQWKFGAVFGIVCAGGEVLFFLGLDQLNKFDLSGLSYPATLSCSIILFAMYCRFVRKKKFSRLELVAEAISIAGILLLAF